MKKFLKQIAGDINFKNMTPESGDAWGCGTVYTSNEMSHRPHCSSHTRLFFETLEVSQ